MKDPIRLTNESLLRWAHPVFLGYTNSYLLSNNPLSYGTSSAPLLSPFSGVLSAFAEFLLEVRSFELMIYDSPDFVLSN
jgi:hypothetical protein